MTDSGMAEPLLEIRGLKTHFATDDGMVQAVDGVDLVIGRGETVGVVGESGCGKTVTALSVLKLIAMALACDPKILIADEPTTALDVTIQAGILDLMRDIRDRLGTAILLITHNLGVVADIADRVVVMYAGRKAEEAPVHELFAHPQHPYTIGLLGAIPRRGVDRLREIPGIVPSLSAPLDHCAFAARCPRADELSRTQVPQLTRVRPEHLVACFHPGENGAA